MNYNYNKLRGRIVEFYGKQSNFAKSLGLSTVSLNKKLNNRVKFTQDEIYKIISLRLLPHCSKCRSKQADCSSGSDVLRNSDTNSRSAADERV